MRRTLLFVLAMLLLVACGDSISDSPPEPVLNTTAHSESDATWSGKGRASDISWRFLDLNHISYQLTWTNLDPSRAVNVHWALHFVDHAGFEIFKSSGTSKIIPAASSRAVQDIINTWPTFTNLDLASQITKMEVWASFTFD